MGLPHSSYKTSHIVSRKHLLKPTRVFIWDLFFFGLPDTLAVALEDVSL